MIDPNDYGSVCVACPANTFNPNVGKTGPESCKPCTSLGPDYFTDLQKVGQCGCVSPSASPTAEPTSPSASPTAEPTSPRDSFSENAKTAFDYTEKMTQAM